MANSQGANGGTKSRGRQRSHNELNGKKPSKSGGGAKVTHGSEDASDPRSIQLEELDGRLSPTGTAATPIMTSESHATPIPKSTHRGSHHHRRGSDEKRRRRRRSSLKEGGDTAHVDRSPRRRANAERNSGSDADSSSSGGDPVKVVRPKEGKVRVVYVDEGEDDERTKRRRERRIRSKELSEASKAPVRRTRTHHTRRKSVVEAPLPRRSASTKDIPSLTSRPTIKRSNTTSTLVPQTKAGASSSTTVKRSSFFGSLFGSTVKQPVEPEKLVECLTCLSDDVPRSKSAKLKCGHRMCHSCLKRIFRLSVNDPQHMPPKCCTADHIPLKHVDKLFNIEFKKTWNRKFHEFSTKNRIYCPGKRCGEWIKPANIYKEDGRKIGKCSRCKTKVCCLCNGKWHGTRDCPKDEETNRLLDAAREAGWQRCYSCRTMVELKEGCNHMTCRCTAEFCMICGLKWKSCDCPWFSVTPGLDDEDVEGDRLNHMRVPENPRPERRNRLQRPPLNYQEELNRRRRQERADEELARRLQRAAISGDDNDDDDDDDYQGGIGDIDGVGNGAGHFMNQDYVRAAHNILTGRFDEATAAANYVMGVAQARRGGRGQRREAVAAAAAAGGPRRMSGRFPMPEAPPPPPTAPAPAPEPEPMERRNGNARPAVLAGLAGRSGNNRVNAWRNHVEVGPPEEGVLSI